MNYCETNDAILTTGVLLLLKFLMNLKMLVCCRSWVSGSIRSAQHAANIERGDGNIERNSDFMRDVV